MTVTQGRSPTRGTGRQPAGAAVLREDVTSAIEEAVLAELAEVGYGRLSIEAVARRAGVGKTAVYRRWDSKLPMVIEMVGEVAAQKFPLPDTGALRSDLRTVLGMLAAALRHPIASKVIPDLLAEASRNPALAATLTDALRANLLGAAGTLIDRAVARGELATGADPQLLVDLLVGPLYWRLVVTRLPLRRGELDELAAAMVAAVRS